MTSHVILIRQSSSLRQIAAEEAVQALEDADQKLDRTSIDVVTAQFQDAIEQGDWAGQDYYLREQATKIRALADAQGEAAIHYFGLAEVPHVIALGAHVGDERAVQLHDHDRDKSSWRWPVQTGTIRVKTTGTEQLKSVVPARGAVVIRVAISAAISDADVREAIGEETLADVMIAPADDIAPTVGLVRSAEDLAVIRQTFRNALGALRAARPGVDTIHLFVAAPPSVCFAIGQELTPRNSPPIQTYRYRKVEGEPSLKPAILLTAAGEQMVLAPVSAEEVARARHIREELWQRAISDVDAYTAKKVADGFADGVWFKGLEPREPLDLAEPFPALPALAKVVPQGATVDSAPYAGDYMYEAAAKRWRLGDRLLAGLDRAASGDDERLRQLIRLFLFHEYLHRYHSISNYTAAEVGKFGNCLEHIDYTADSYALLHQLDWTATYEQQKAGSDDDQRRFLAQQIELAILSFWAFDRAAGAEWQVRRIRRYFNWYWRLVQVENSEDLVTVMHLFNRQPHLEIGGLHQVARGPRVLVDLNRRDNTTFLELALVLEDDRLYRQSASPNINLSALFDAFQSANHDEIKGFFRALFDTAKATRGALPVSRE